MDGALDTDIGVRDSRPKTGAGAVEYASCIDQGGGLREPPLLRVSSLRCKPLRARLGGSQPGRQPDPWQPWQPSTDATDQRSEYSTELRQRPARLNASSTVKRCSAMRESVQPTPTLPFASRRVTGGAVDHCFPPHARPELRSPSQHRPTPLCRNAGVDLECAARPSGSQWTFPSPIQLTVRFRGPPVTCDGWRSASDLGPE
jgi:hypothetical protein